MFRMPCERREKQELMSDSAVAQKKTRGLCLGELDWKQEVLKLE